MSGYSHKGRVSTGGASTETGGTDSMGGGGVYHSNASSSTKWLGRIPVSESSEFSVSVTNAGSSVLSGKIEKADENENTIVSSYRCRTRVQNAE